MRVESALETNALQAMGSVQHNTDAITSYVLDNKKHFFQTNLSYKRMITDEGTNTYINRIVELRIFIIRCTIC